MNLEEQIRQLNNPQEFVDITNTIFADKYGNDFQVIDGTRSDQGNDGYIRSEKRILAIFCPIKPERLTDKKYKDKIEEDLKKAKELHNSGRLQIKNWTFVTPGTISNEVFLYLQDKAREFGFEANNIEATFLAGELYKRECLLKKFPKLYIPKIEEKLEEMCKKLDELKRPHKEDIVIPVDKKLEISEKKEGRSKKSNDLNRVLEIIRNEQTDASKTELRAILYRTTDKIAQINAIFGLLKWYDPLEDKDIDMVDLCDLGIDIANILNEKGLRAICLSYKGLYLSSAWAKEDMQTAYTIRAGNMIGIPMLSQEQIQVVVEKLHRIEDQFQNAFREASDIGIELKNGNILAQICLNIGQAAGGRYIHLSALDAKERAAREKALSKRALISAKEFYSAIGYELGVGYALHNLANQLNTFGEEKEALELNKIVLEIATKHKDASLLQTANWLKETLETGKVPDYAHGERRERKK